MFKKKFICNQCKIEITPGEFMAVLAKSPDKEYVSSTKSILQKWIKQTDGLVYCRDCFSKKYEIP